MIDKKYERLLDLVLEKLENAETIILLKDSEIQELKKEIKRLNSKQNIMSCLKDKMEVR